ncbi:MAG: hypothetical protein IT324_31530 [Anaerolineae bacterium]|nr:hypothetical protein [Anaerolineae bacterium]
MVKSDSSSGNSFAEACEYLNLTPDLFSTLRDQGLIACFNPESKPIYPTVALDITRRLMTLGAERQWEQATLAWYADLVFATEVGRSILLPISQDAASTSVKPTSWLLTHYTNAVLEDLNEETDAPDGALVALLRSLVAVGKEQFWDDLNPLEQSALYPIITHLEQSGVPIIGQNDIISRDAGPIFGSMILAFVTIAPAISQELNRLVQVAYSKLKGRAASHPDVPSDERSVITSESHVAVDKIYASKATEIHTPPDVWDFKLGVLIAQKRTIAIQLKLPLETTEEIIDNIIDIIRPYVDTFGARVVQVLYEIANDAPYWRNPLITIDTNEVLDRLGIKRDKNGHHYSDSRERLRNALNAAHNLEIVGEYTTRENGRPVRKALRRTVISLIGATFDAEENSNLSTTELFQRGLPKTMQIRLNFYDGVRRPDGRLGNQYVLTPRLREPAKLPSARHATTEELLKSYLLLRYRQTKMESRTLTVARGTALEKANVTTKHVTRATQILTRALDKLVADGTIEAYSPIPTKSQHTFTVTLAK